MANTLMSKLDFGNEAADDVPPEETADFFVEQRPFAQFCNPSKSILLATAKKGVGKSALLKWVEAGVRASADTDALVISVKGSDLVRSVFGLTTELSLPNDYIRDWMVRLCSLINRRIGAELPFAFSDDTITMVEASEIDGFRSKNILTALTQRLRKILPTLEATRHLPPSEVELLRRYEGRPVWILIDDLDATYQRTTRENIELGTFFSACRYLVSMISGLRIRITMRTDVWTMIRRYDESLDKFEQYVHDIRWTPADFRTLLYKRIHHQRLELGLGDPETPPSATPEEVEEYLIDKIFEKRMEWGEKLQRTYRVVFTLSYARPRWAIQLCKLAQEEALREDAYHISKKHIDMVWGEYGQKRIADLVAEHKHQCAEIEELLVAFRGAPRRMSRDELLNHIRRTITNHMTPAIEGRSAKDPLDVAHFLFRLGFILARSNQLDSSWRADDLGEEGIEPYEHYSFAEMPDFLSTRTNADFGVEWEIHPCYREALDIRKLDASHRRVRQRNR